MKLGEAGYRGKTVIIAGVAGITVAGSELAGADIAGEALLSTTNWLGKVGLLWAGVRFGQIGIAKLAEGMYRQEAADWADVNSGLPALQDGVSPVRIMSRVWNKDN